MYNLRTDKSMCFGTVSVELSSSYDTYLVVPASNSTSRLLEIDHIETWAAENNLMLNHSKSKEIIFTARGKRGKSVQLPSPCLDIERERERVYFPYSKNT